MPAAVAIIGSGWTDRVQIPAFQAAGLRIVALAGRDPERTREVAARHGIPRSTTRWQELLDSEAELISVATPPRWHLEMGRGVLEAGKHLLLEKPLALDSNEAQQLAAAADAHPELLALVDHELRFLPARRKARELLSGGVIGKPMVISARVATDNRIDPNAAWNWWSDAEQGGGMLGAIGSHVLDGISWLLGGRDIALGGASLGRTYERRRDETGTERPVTADDIAALSFRAGDAVGSALLHGAALDGAVDLLTLRGGEGTLVIDRSLKLYLGKRDGALKEYRVQLPDLVPNRFRASGYGAGTVLLGHALERALGHGDLQALAPAATVHDGVRVQRLLDEARRVAANRGPS